MGRLKLTAPEFMKTSERQLITVILTLTLAGALLPQTLRAGFSLPSGSTSPGHGISNVLSGTVANGALFWQSTTNWVNTTPAKPYAVTNNYALPACDSIAVARIVATIWGGTANYVSEMTVTVNGTNLPAANPLVFGTTTDTNAVFSATSANAYGSGSGVWLVTLPVPASMLFTDGTLNNIVVSQNTTTGFDGRVQHVTLLVVYQSSALNNTFDYAIAEGGGDIYKSPAGTQVSQRTVTFDAVHPATATAATLNVLYTYADALNDRLYFNGTQFGGDNVAQFDTSVVNNGPSVLSFDVLANLVTTNTVTFSLGADVPGTPETSLRPQLAALAVTRTAATILAPTLAITVQTNLARLTITGESNRTYTVLSSPDLFSWSTNASFISSNAVSQWSVPATNTTRFFRVRAQ